MITLYLGREDNKNPKNIENTTMCAITDTYLGQLQNTTNNRTDEVKI